MEMNLLYTLYCRQCMNAQAHKLAGYRRSNGMLRFSAVRTNPKEDGT